MRDMDYYQEKKRQHLEDGFCVIENVLPPELLQAFVVATRSRNPQWEIEDSVLAAMRPDCPPGIEATPSSRTRFRREDR
jgi:hypothetical protein